MESWRRGIRDERAREGEGRVVGRLTGCMDAEVKAQHCCGMDNKGQQWDKPRKRARGEN